MNRLSRIASIISIFTVSALLNVQNVFADYPSQVPNATVNTNNNTVTLQWDEATSDDDVIVSYKIYYGKESVQEEGQEYSETPITVGSEDERKYVFENLEPNTQYFFSITAIDSLERESANYSLELSATPGENVNTVTEPVVIEEPVETEPVIESPVTEEIIEPVAEPVAEPTEIVQPPVNEDPIAPIDTQAPVAPTEVKANNQKNVAIISWKKSVSNDVTQQQLAYKTTNGNWQYKNLSASAQSSEFNTELNKRYTVKIQSFDAAGNKAESKSVSFTSSLTKSGPGTTLAVVIALAFLGLLLFSAKRKA